MHKYDVVIIGGGLGGLECGLILSKEGMSVCVLEQHHKIGGNLQCFSRNGVIFDTGMHYFGSMADGEYLHKYLKYFGIADKLKLRRLDLDGFDTISFDGEDREYGLSQGYDQFAANLLHHFPEERSAIDQYIAGIKSVTDNFPMYKPGSVESFDVPISTLEKCAFGFLDSLGQNNRLKNVLAGGISLYPGHAKSTPLYVHACMRDSLITSCWRPIDGSQQIADRLAEGIEGCGGTVLASHKVKEIIVKDQQVEAVLLENGERISGKHFISNVHPVSTFKLIEEGKLRKFYRNRITGLDNTWGAFSLYAVLQKDAFPYLNKNYFHYQNEGILNTDYDQKSWPNNYYFYTPASSSSDKYAESFTIIADMKFDEVSKWQGTRINQRGEDYKELKAKKTERLLDAIEKRFPGIRSKIVKTYSSTPLTFQDYTATHQGAAYGIMKDCNDPIRSIILPKTKISNLYFTGQNLNLHGMMGVTAGAVITCSELLGLKYLTNKIANG